MASTRSTDERQRIIEEEQNARKRQNRMDQATEKVRAGQLRKQKRLEEEELDRLHNLRYHVRLRNKQNNAVVTIQQYYRGHIGRKAASLWREHFSRIQAHHALYVACSTTISRYWRGWKGRQEAKVRRREMAEFIIAMRQIDLDAEQTEANRKKKRKRGWNFSFSLLNFRSMR